MTTHTASQPKFADRKGGEAVADVGKLREQEIERADTDCDQHQRSGSTRTRRSRAGGSSPVTVAIPARSSWSSDFETCLRVRADSANGWRNGATRRQLRRAEHSCSRRDGRVRADDPGQRSEQLGAVDGLQPR